MKINCIAIDDEPPALDLVTEYILKTPFLQLAGVFTNANEFMEKMDSLHIDLILLDIHMPGISGLHLAKVLRNGPKIIFTTAYEKYAIDGFKLEVIDYLLKPYSYEEFLKSCTRAYEYIRLVQGYNAKSHHSAEYIFVKSGYKLLKVHYKDIIYVESCKDYVLIHLTDTATPVSTIMSLKSIEEILPSERFMRVHRSYIVALDKIKVIERNCIVFGKFYIPVTDQYKTKFTEYLNNNLPS